MSRALRSICLYCDGSTHRSDGTDTTGCREHETEKWKVELSLTENGAVVNKSVAQVLGSDTNQPHCCSGCAEREGRNLYPPSFSAHDRHDAPVWSVSCVCFPAIFNPRLHTATFSPVANPNPTRQERPTCCSLPLYENENSILVFAKPQSCI